MPDQAQLVLLDDGLVDGGGQLGLGRYLRQPSSLRREVVLLAPNRVADDAGAVGLPAIVLQQRTNRRGLPKAWVRLLSRHSRRAPSQIVVANSLMAGIVLAATPKRGRRFVYYMREDFSPDWITGWKRRIVQRLVFPRYDGFLANSSWTGSTMPVGRTGPRSVEVAYPLSGIADVEQAAPADNDDLRVLSLSRLAHWKGIDVAVDAAVELADRGQTIKLTVAGGDAAGEERYAGQLRERVAPPGLTLTFTGHVDDVAALLADHDVLLVCSRHPEPFGQVVVQALAWGLVVVASAHGGPADLLADEPLGVLVPPDDPAALAGALRALAENPPSRDSRLRSAQSARARFNDAALAAAFEAAVSVAARR